MEPIADSRGQRRVDLAMQVLPFDDVPWAELDAAHDRVVFQTRAWLEFIAAAQAATPIVVQILDGPARVGFFTGLTFRRLGVKILGSSFPGWTTPYIGFNLAPGISRTRAVRALQDFAFSTLGCWHVEVSDAHITPSEAAASGLEHSFFSTQMTDLRSSEDALFGAMSSACRRCIRKAEKTGIIVEETRDPSFADEYYEQLVDVFAKQRLVPTYTRDRVRSLVTHLAPTGDILLLRARSASGRCIATGIYPGFNQHAFFWGNASWRQYQGDRPNEYLHWYAMRYWKRRGAVCFDWGGASTYKEKYGVQPWNVPWFSRSRYRVLSHLRNGARSAFYLGQRVAGAIRHRTARADPDADRSAEAN
jgi:hypothetical protein